MPEQRGRPRQTRPETREHLFALALAGLIPAEVLPQHLRGQLVAELHADGWTDVQVAAHCRMTTYTAARIREGLELPANRPRETSGAA